MAPKKRTDGVPVEELGMGSLLLQLALLAALLGGVTFAAFKSGLAQDFIRGARCALGRW
jgi:hypothetical protein